MKKVSDMFAKCRFCVGYDQLTTNATVEKSARIHSFSVKVVLETDVGISLDNPRNVLPDWNISSSVSLSLVLSGFLLDWDMTRNHSANFFLSKGVLFYHCCYE